MGDLASFLTFDSVSVHAPLRGVGEFSPKFGHALPGSC